ETTLSCVAMPVRCRGCGRVQRFSARLSGAPCEDRRTVCSGGGGRYHGPCPFAENERVDGTASDRREPPERRGNRRVGSRCQSRAGWVHASLHDQRQRGERVAVQV